LKGLLLEPSAELEFLAQPTYFFGERPFVEHIADPIIVLGRLSISRERERKHVSCCWARGPVLKIGLACTDIFRCGQSRGAWTLCGPLI
jgi:hypothetical protein